MNIIHYYESMLSGDSLFVPLNNNSVENLGRFLSHNSKITLVLATLEDAILYSFSTGLALKVMPILS